MNASILRSVVTLTRLGTALALIVGAGTPAAMAQSAFWNAATTTGGSWGTSSNWQGGIVPSGAGNAAGFALDFTSGASVTLDGDRTIGSVISTGANPWSIDPGTGGTLTAASFVISGGGPLTVNAPLAGTDLTKDGSGTLTLSNPGSVYTGVINIRDGTLKLVGAANFATTGIVVNLATGATLDATGLTSGVRYGGDPSLRINVNNGDTLTGTGIVSGGLKVNNGGTVFPGTNGVGALTVTGGDGNFKQGSTWKVQLATANAGGTNTSNRIDFPLNSLTVDSSATLPIDGNGLTFAGGSTYDYVIATSGLRSFTFGSVTFVPTNFSPAGIATPADFTLVSSGQDLILQFTPVPEPAFVMAIVLGGAAGLGWLRRRRGLVAT